MEEITTLILAPRVSLENKKQIFQILIERHNPDFKKQYPNYIKDLVTIIEKRNILAHYPLDSSDAALRKYKSSSELYFMKFKNVTEKVTKKIILTNSPVFLVFSIFQIKSFVIHTGLELVFDFG
jgi:hypothetical protein